MVNLAKFIVGWFRLFPIMFFCLAGFGLLWNPLYWVFLILSIVSAGVWYATHKWAEKIAPSSTPFMDYFWDLYDRSQKILEEHYNKVK